MLLHSIKIKSFGRFHSRESVIRSARFIEREDFKVHTSFEYLCHFPDINSLPNPFKESLILMFDF